MVLPKKRTRKPTKKDRVSYSPGSGTSVLDIWLKNSSPTPQTRTPDSDTSSWKPQARGVALATPPRTQMPPFSQSQLKFTAVQQKVHLSTISLLRIIDPSLTSPRNQHLKPSLPQRVRKRYPSRTRHPESRYLNTERNTVLQTEAMMLRQTS